MLFLAGVAFAFPTMIRHGYRACAQCHVDPSGAGALTDYGRAQAEILVAQTWGKPVADPGSKADFLYGALAMPEALTLQFDLRTLVIPQPGNFRLLLMQSDLRAAIDVGPLLAYASAGVVSEGGQGAWITSNADGFNLVSREWWLGAEPGKDVLVRAGRMNLPFGVRTENHLLFTRQATRTTINDDQQVGVAASWSGRRARVEVMGIAGNLQVAPDAFRERGYSGYLAFTPMKTVELGLSSLVTHAELDVDTLAERTRQAHGVFTRTAPVDPLVVMVEADVLVDADATGLATTLDADWELVQGVHAKANVEFCDADFDDGEVALTRYGGAMQWFLQPRVQIRADAFFGTLSCTPGVEPSFLALAQMHWFL